MPQLLWHVKDSKSSIFLTFDDGPIPEVTPWVLDQLDRYKAKASFFCVGDNIIKYPELFNKLKLNGHFIGSHTFNHLSGWSTNTGEYLENVHKGASLVPTNFFRPPYGRITPAQFKILKNYYQIVMWDVLSGDFDPFIKPEICLNNVIKNTKPGSILVFHDSLKAWKNLEYTLPRVLDHFTKLNYSFDSFETISEQISNLEIPN